MTSSLLLAGSKSFSVCTKHKDRYWCSTKNKADGKYEKWGYCPEGGTCPPGGGGGYHRLVVVEGG